MISLILRSLRYHFRTNLAVIAGVATAVAVLAGALLVGASVRGSLRDLVNGRLGRVDYVASGNRFFREQLASETGGCPLIVIQGVVTNANTRRRASGVWVYGVDERFWNFQGWQPGSDVQITPALARETGAGELLIRVDKPSAIPKESLHGRKDEGKTLRVQAQPSAPDFALRPQQGDVLAVFVPLRRLQRELGQAARVNTILYAGTAAPDLKSKVTLQDIGIKVRALSGGGLSIESDAAILNDAAAAAVGPAGHPVFSYLANSIRVNGREIPYSLVTAVDQSMMPVAPGGIFLNDWAAGELGAHTGDSVTLDYYLWSDGGNLVTRTAAFRLQGILPIRGLAADRELTPEYPGITEARTLRDWDPPFPMDLSRIRPKDEQYWERYRTTPKAFISIETGQRLWGSRFGRMTSLRVAGDDREALEKQLIARLDPAQFGIAVYPTRTAGIESAKGSTDFGEYFTYFSFFLVASAALLAALFFRLGVEERHREIGTLRATGWPLARVRRVLLAEGVVLSVIGSVLGVIGAIGYCAFVLYGLRTWWRGAVGTTALRLHLDAASLVSGAVMGGVIAVIVIWFSLRALRRISARALLAGGTTSGPLLRPKRWVRFAALLAAIGALAMVGAGISRAVSASEAFFGAGSLFLLAALMGLSVWLRTARHTFVSLDHSATLWNLGLRNASYRPGRSLLCIALIASAVFLIVALDAFRQSGAEAAGPKSGTGGFALLAESQLPVLWNPNSPAGRENMNLTAVADQLRGVRFQPFRLRPGEDASCLNLYEPRNPRVLGAGEQFIAMNRFSFSDSLAKTPQEKENPWLLLNGDASGAVPAIADANSITYVLHRKLGDEFEIDGHKVRLVAALSGSVLQSELIISERNFIRLFPDEQGYRFFAIDAPSPAVGDVLEDALSDYGFDATSSAERLAAYHRVENTYLSTFQALGALGLLLGTVGLAAVLLRNVLERRRELALLTALGYRRDQLTRLVLAENAFLVICGLITGALCAALAVAPAALERGAAAPFGALALLLVVVPLTALLSSLAAVRVVRQAPLLETLRAE